jgi:predicted ferric reductase
MSNGDAVHFGESTNSGLTSARLAVIDRRPFEHVGSGGDRLVRPWFGRPGRGALLCAVYPLLAIAPVIALRLLNRDVDYATATALGVNCALVGFTLLSMQFLLTARLSWIEAPFGLDLILRFHRAMAFVIVALLCVHPMLIASDQGERLLTGLHMPWCIWAGRIALILLVGLVSAALFRSAMRLSYEWWKRLHNGIALVVLALGFAHAVTTGEDLQNPAGLVLWTVMPATGLAAWFYAHAIRPRLLARRVFRVHAVKLEAPRVWTITLAAPAGRPFRFLPGQFQFLRFLDSNVPAEEHPFSIASSPSRAQRISLTIKACGNFTNLIDRIHVGDRATVHGPFGRFSCDLHRDEGHLVFVAGGVGITPLMSMLRAMRDRHESRQVTLIYASRQVNDVLFAPELVAMERAQCPALKVIHVLSKPPTWWAGQTGRVDAQRLDEWCGGVEDKAFYLCCPTRMNAELIAGLRRNGVSPRRIHCDDFSL